MGSFFYLIVKARYESLMELTATVEDDDGHPVGQSEINGDLNDPQIRQQIIDLIEWASLFRKVNFEFKVSNGPEVIHP